MHTSRTFAAALVGCNKVKIPNGAARHRTPRTTRLVSHSIHTRTTRVATSSTGHLRQKKGTTTCPLFPPPAPGLCVSRAMALDRKQISPVLFLSEICQETKRKDGWVFTTRGSALTSTHCVWWIHIHTSHGSESRGVDAESCNMYVHRVMSEGYRTCDLKILPEEEERYPPRPFEFVHM